MDLSSAAASAICRPAPAVANGIVYAKGYQLGVFPAAEEFGGGAWKVDCRRDGGECMPLWRSSGSLVSRGRPLVANGLVGTTSLYSTDCPAGQICSPVFEAEAVTGSFADTAAISDGVLYLPARDRKLYAYGL